MNVKEFKDIKIIFEDNDVAALFKPKNILVHGSGKKKGQEQEGGTLVDYILEKFPDIEGVGEDIMSNENILIQRPGIVHRLDKDTSGIILVAKNQEFFDILKEQFKDRVVQKNYRAFVYGNFIYDKKGVDTPIGRSKNDFRKWATTREIRGQARNAETIFERIDVKAISPGKFISYMDAYPKTGRTHQIRVHAKYLNHPIVADHLYAGKNYDRSDDEGNLYFKSQALFAYSISFFNAQSEWITLKAPWDQEFEKAIEVFNKL